MFLRRSSPRKDRNKSHGNSNHAKHKVAIHPLEMGRKIDHANMFAKPAGPRKRPKLSDMLKRPFIFPRMSERTMLVHVTNNEGLYSPGGMSKGRWWGREIE